MRKFLNPPFLSKTFGIDTRSLAVFRVTLGLLFLYDWFVRITDLRKYYTDDGVFPRVLLLQGNPSPYFIQLHLLSGLASVEYVLFAIAAVSAMFMILGYKTRAATIVTWLLLISIQNRNTLVLHGGDVAFRMAFFWAMFLPLGARWSLDNIRRSAARLAEEKAAGGRPRPAGVSVLRAKGAEGPADGAVGESEPRVLSIATAGVLLQVCFIYWFTAALKSDKYWHNGSAIYFSLQFDQLARPLGIYLLQWPNVLRELTFATYALERLGPLFALCPFWYGRIRAATAASFILFHAILGMVFSLGIFSFACMVPWLLFLPTEFWDTLARWYAAKPRLKLKAPVEKVRALAYRVGNALAEPRGASAAPKPLGEFLRVAGRWTAQGIAGFFIVYLFLWNLRTTNYDRYSAIFPRSVNWIANLTRTDQRWAMFAPPPTTTDGWFVVPAVLASGLEVDLFKNGAPVSWEKPKYVVYTNKNEREQKYMITLATESTAAMRRAYADYLCREWNRTHVETMQVVSIQIYYMNEKTLPDYKVAQPRKRLMGTYFYSGVPTLPASPLTPDVFDPTTIVPGSTSLPDKVVTPR